MSRPVGCKECHCRARKDLYDDWPLGWKQPITVGDIHTGPSGHTYRVEGSQCTCGQFVRRVQHLYAFGEALMEIEMRNKITGRKWSMYPLIENETEGRALYVVDEEVNEQDFDFADSCFPPPIGKTVIGHIGPTDIDDSDRGEEAYVFDDGTVLNISCDPGYDDEGVYRTPDKWEVVTYDATNTVAGQKLRRAFAVPRADPS